MRTGRQSKVSGDGIRLKCRARVGMDRCGNNVAPYLDICAFHAGLQGAWASASLRRPLTQVLYARMQPLVQVGHRFMRGIHHD
jgi:hypothetical protein